MQHERLLADAGALALADLVGEARTLALLEPQHLQAQLLRARDVGQRLARILVRMKHAEALPRDPAGSSVVDGRDLDRGPDCVQRPSA